MHPDTSPARVGLASRPIAALLAALLAAVLLGGCSLRLETDNPHAPTPDAVEVIREAMVLDVLTIRGSAETLMTTGGNDDATTAVLQDILTASTAHLEALGGIYDPGPDYVVAQAEPTPSQAPPTLETLTATLADAANRTRSALEATAAPLDARLFATIATAHYGYALSLANAADTALPDIDLVRAAVNPELPIPAELETSDYQSLVVTQDAIGYIREMWGLHLDGNRKDRVLAQSRSDRDRARTLASRSGLIDTADDPRELFYEFDRDITRQRAARRTIAELRLAQVHRFSALLPDVASGERANLLDWMVQSYHDALRTGATPEPFPGMPEYEAADVG